MRLRTFWKRERGTASVEFVLLFPFFIAIMLSSIEAGVYMARKVMLDRGLNIAVRALRLGMEEDPTFAEFKQMVCSETLLLSDCAKSIKVELTAVDMTTWTGLGTTAQCRDVSKEIDPADETKMSVGENNELMMVRACGIYNPFWPGTIFGLRLKDMGDGAYALVVQSAFVNEPSK